MVPWPTTQKSSARQGSSLSICSSIGLCWDQVGGDGRTSVRVEAHESRDGHRVRCDLRTGDKVHFRFHLNQRALRDLHEQAQKCGIGAWQVDIQDAQGRGEETLLRAHDELLNMQKRISAFEWDSFMRNPSTAPAKCAQYTRVQLTALGEVLGTMMRALGRVFPSAPLAFDVHFQVVGVLVDRLLGLVASGVNSHLATELRNCETLKLIDEAEAEQVAREGSGSPRNSNVAKQRHRSTVVFDSLRSKFEQSASRETLARSTVTAMPMNNCVDHGVQAGDGGTYAAARGTCHIARWNSMLAAVGDAPKLKSQELLRECEDIFNSLAGSDMTDPLQIVLTSYLKQHGTKRAAERALVSVILAAERETLHHATHVVRILRFCPVASAFSRDQLYAFTHARQFCVENHHEVTFERAAKFLAVSLRIQHDWYGIDYEWGRILGIDKNVLPASELWSRLENMALPAANGMEERLELLRCTLCTRLGNPDVDVFTDFAYDIDQGGAKCSTAVFNAALMDKFYHALGPETLACFATKDTVDLKLFVRIMTSGEPLPRTGIIDDNDFVELAMLAWNRLEKCIDNVVATHFATHASRSHIHFPEFAALCQEVSSLPTKQVVDMFDHCAEQETADMSVDEEGVDAQTFAYTFRRYVRATIFPAISASVSIQGIRKLLEDPRSTDDPYARMTR